MSNNFYSSVVSLCEMGATWVKTSHHIPILIPPFNYDDVKGVIPTTQGMKINEKEKINSLKSIVEDRFEVAPVGLNFWERKRDKILKEIKTILDADISHDNSKIDESISVNSSENYREIIKQRSKIEWPGDFEMQLDYIQRQNSAVEKLKNHRPIDIDPQDFNLVREKAKTNWPDDFEMQLDQEQRQVESYRRLKDA